MGRQTISFWKFLGSVNLALVLFCVIIVASFIGAVLPEGQQPLVYYSWWFIALLAFFAVNILVCSLTRLSFAKRKIGSTLTHVSVLIILAGALISYLASIRGAMELEVGKTSGVIRVPSTRSEQCSVRTVPFKIMLQDFTVQWYAQTPQVFPISVRVKDKGYTQSLRLAKGQKQQLGPTGYSVAVIDYMPDFSIDENMKAANRSAQPNNPAVLLAITSEQGIEQRWVFAKHGEMGTAMAKDKKIQVTFDWMPVPQEYRSTIRVIDEAKNKTLDAVVKVNQPFSYQGYTVYQAGYDEENPKLTVLDVVHDPGVGVVFTGFILLNAGLVAVFYPKLRLPRRSKSKEGRTT